MGFFWAHLCDLGLGESDGEQQPRDQPTRYRFDSRFGYVGLGSGPPTDDLPEASLGDLKLIAKDPMEQVVADLGALIVRNLRPKARTVGQLAEVAPMIADSSAPPS